MQTLKDWSYAFLHIGSAENKAYKGYLELGKPHQNEIKGTRGQMEMPPWHILLSH